MTSFCSIGMAALLIAMAGCASTAGSQFSNPFPAAQAPGEAADTQQEINNKRVVLQYYDAANNAKNAAQATRFVSVNLRLHDPAIPDGIEGLQSRIQSLQNEYPGARVEVKRVLTSGDQVFLHSHAVLKPNTVGFIAGDIFRLEGGKIVEQWSVLHPIPEKPHRDNSNGPF